MEWSTSSPEKYQTSSVFSQTFASQTDQGPGVPTSRSPLDLAGVPGGIDGAECLLPEPCVLLRRPRPGNHQAPHRPSQHLSALPVVRHQLRVLREQTSKDVNDKDV